MSRPPRDLFLQDNATSKVGPPDTLEGRAIEALDRLLEAVPRDDEVGKAVRMVVAKLGVKALEGDRSLDAAIPDAGLQRDAETVLMMDDDPDSLSVRTLLRDQSELLFRLIGIAREEALADRRAANSSEDTRGQA